MSSESRHTPTTQLGRVSCSFCDCVLTEQLLALQAYASSTTSVPEELPDHGGLTLCAECATDVAELLASWEPRSQPPVSETASIGDGYRAVSTSCSFCADHAAESLLGIELYRRVGDQLPAYANYTLCPDCQSVFGEFVQNVRQASR